MSDNLPSKSSIAWGALLVCACVLPVYSSDYRLFQYTMTIVYAIALMGLNVLVGYNGQVSLGHGAFFAVGAYTAAVLMDRFGVPYWLTIIVGGVLSGLLGFIFGLPALRLQGHYLALATLGLALAVPQLLKYRKLEGWTGGSQGLVLVKPDAPSWFPIGQDQWLYILSLGLLVILFMAARNMMLGRTGRSLKAIRDHHTAAQALGVDASLYKSLAFSVSAFYTGIAGALGAIVVQFVSPDSFTMLFSISLLIGITVGGLGSMSGAILGAVFIQFVPNLTEEISKSATWAVYGLTLIIFALLLPSGLAGALSRLRIYWQVTRRSLSSRNSSSTASANPR